MLNCLQATGCNDGLFQQTVVFSNPTLFYSIPNNQNLDKPHLAAPRTILGKKKKKKKITSIGLLLSVSSLTVAPPLLVSSGRQT